MFPSNRRVSTACLGLALLGAAWVAPARAAEDLGFITLKAECDGAIATAAQVSSPATASLLVPGGRLDGPQEVDPSYCGVDWKYAGCCASVHTKLHCTSYYCCRTRPDGVRECGMLCEADWCTATCEL